MHSRMKFYVAALTYVLNALWNLGMVSCTDDLRAVSSSAVLGKFYLEMKRLHSMREPKYDNEENKEAICNAILSSAHFFYVHEVRPVNFSDEWVQDQLTIHADLYPKSLRKNFSDGQATPYKYSKKTIKYLDENIQEYVFPCAAKKRRSEHLEIYFISYKYDLCMVQTEHRIKRSHMGRFVFECNAKERKLNLIALAENSVQVHEFELEEQEYPKDSLLMKEVQRNVLCNHLTPFEKLRVCSMALNADDYRGVVLFLSRDEDVLHQCENVNLIYHSHSGRYYEYEKFFNTSQSKLIDGNVHENVMAFRCVAKFVGHEARAADIFISFGDEKHKFFISSQEGNQTFIKKFFYLYNVSPKRL